MLRDIKQLAELYLHSTGKLPDGKSWDDFHVELIQNAPRDAIGLLADANPKDKCKYALFVNVDIKNKSCEVKYKNFDNFVAIEKVDDWSNHLFWQGSGGAQSDKIRNTPHKKDLFRPRLLGHWQVGVKRVWDYYQNRPSDKRKQTR